MQLNRITRLRLSIAACAATLCATVAMAHQAAQASAKRIGDVSVSNMGTLTYRTNGKKQPGVAQILLTGPKLQITSARYDMASPNIVLALSKGKVQTGTATGSVRIAVRNPEEKQNTTLTCNKAIYKASGANGAGRIDLTGNIHSVIRSPDFETPVVTDAKTGYVDFASDGETTVFLDGEGNGSITGTPIERAPKKKP